MAGPGGSWPVPFAGKIAQGWYWLASDLLSRRGFQDHFGQEIPAGLVQSSRPRWPVTEALRSSDSRFDFAPVEDFCRAKVVDRREQGRIWIPFLSKLSRYAHGWWAELRCDSVCPRWRARGAWRSCWRANDSAAPALRLASAFASLRRDKPDWSQRDDCHRGRIKRRDQSKPLYTRGGQRLSATAFAGAPNHPGGQARWRPPRMWQCRCGTVSPPSGPLLMTRR